MNPYMVMLAFVGILGIVPCVLALIDGGPRIKKIALWTMGIIFALFVSPALITLWIRAIFG
ncbi:MAG TPA: hypothetical protein VNS29_15395 [Burkholderiaceae bacterium]|nr:hypothetical protein [Burkholderiaceae bacterium]